MSAYRILDEPRPSGLNTIVVDPMWPLLATMMVGGGIGLAWLALNAWAVGSPTRIRESLICLGGLVGFMTLFVLLASLDLEQATFRYAFIGVIVVKLAAAYWASSLQQQAVDLYDYFNGRKQNGLVVLMIGAFLLRPMIAAAAKDHGWLYLLVA
ncbi:MAG: hypothetical protein IPK97_08985 [Ahniella sp.]|nr:hypothetical protein [Ahniella sp.]